MSDKYDLDENIEDGFNFKVEGVAYRMRYPTTEEITDMEKFKDDQEKMLTWMYSFASPVTTTDPSLKETMKKVNVKKLQRFNEMIKDEFGAEA